MKSAAFLFRCSLLFLMVWLVGTQPSYGISASDYPGSNVSSGNSAGRPSWDVTGTWSGTFESRQPSFSPFTLTVVIHPDPRGQLVGNSSVSSDCLTDGSFLVTVRGSTIVLAGGDEKGNHITFEGTIDRTGALLNLRYVLNGSASARCESDDGTGTMVKR